PRRAVPWPARGPERPFPRASGWYIPAWRHTPSCWVVSIIVHRARFVKFNSPPWSKRRSCAIIEAEWERSPPMYPLIRQYLRRVDAPYLALCVLCSALSVVALVSLGQSQLGSNNKASVQLIASLLGVM